jgi:hypothetical protein
MGGGRIGAGEHRRAEANPDRCAYLLGIGARRLRSEDPRRTPRRRAPSPRGPRKLPGIGASALARGRLGGRGCWALPPGFVCRCWLWGLMAGLFVKPPPRLRSYGRRRRWGRTHSISRSVPPAGREGRPSFYLALYLANGCAVPTAQN